MSKAEKLQSARQHAKWVIDRCEIANAHAMSEEKTDLNEFQKKAVNSALGNALVGYKLGLREAKGDIKKVTTMGKLDNGGWLRIGTQFLIQMEEGKKPYLVCDTCSATMAAKLSRDIIFKNTKVEMIRCGFNIHHFLAVDRADGNLNSFMAWGEDAFLIDIWDDKLNPSKDEDKLNGVFDKPALSHLAIDHVRDLAVTQTFIF